MVSTSKKSGEGNFCMSIATEYKAIYRREVEAIANNIIYIYTPVTDIHIFQALSHNCKMCHTNGCSEDCYVKLGALMRKNLVFYCYGEDEIVQKFNNGMFSNLDHATLFAYKNRLPKRGVKQDGLPGEVMLDLIVQIHEPNAYKLAVRAIFRQDDNNEIKGFDLTYFSLQEGHISLWLGQAKMGTKNYCKTGIHTDLLSKFKNEYLSRQVYFISEKQAGLTEEGKAITDAINALNILTIHESDENRAKALIRYFIDNNITINIPCLMAYGEGSVYADIPGVAQGIDEEMKQIRKFFTANSYIFDGFTPNIIFIVFPLKDLDKLRSDGGFYNGLH